MMLQMASVLESLVFVYIYYFRCVSLLLGLFADKTHTLREQLHFGAFYKLDVEGDNR